MMERLVKNIHASIKGFEKSPARLLCDYTLIGALFLKLESHRHQRLRDSLLETFGAGEQFETTLKAARLQFPAGTLFDEVNATCTDANAFWSKLREIKVAGKPLVATRFTIPDEDAVEMRKHFRNILDAVSGMEFPSDGRDGNDFLREAVRNAYLRLSGGSRNAARALSATPHNIARLMVALTDPQKGETVFDPACGIGELLMMAGLHGEEIRLFGNDLNPMRLACCEMNLRFHGLDACLEVGNALTDDTVADGRAEDDASIRAKYACLRG